MSDLLDPAPEPEVESRRRIAPVAAAAAAIVVAALVAVLVLSLDDGGEQYAASPIVGDIAPPISGETFDGETIDVNDYRGRWLVVNFFATWCIPCVEEHPELVEFDEDHRRAGDAGVVSVVVDTPEDEARDFFAERGGDWPVVLDPEARTPLDYGMLKVPETFLVRPDGVVVQRILGGVTAEGLDSLIEAYEDGAA